MFQSRRVNTDDLQTHPPYVHGWGGGGRVTDLALLAAVRDFNAAVGAAVCAGCARAFQAIMGR